MQRWLITAPSLALPLFSGARIRRAFAQLLLTLACVLCLPAAHAALNGDLPARSDIQNQLETLNKQKALTPVDKLSQQDLARTLELLDAIERNKQDAAQLKQQLQQAPAKLNQVTAELDALKQPPDSAAARAELMPLSLRQLESRLYQTLDELQNAQESLSTYNSQLVSLQTQPERVQSTMYTASQRLQEIRNQINGQTPGQDSLRNTQQVMLATEQALLNAQIDLQRRSLEANTTLQDLLQKQRDYTTAHIDALDHSVQLLQEVVNSKRLTLSEKTAKEAQNPEDATDIQHDRLVSKELDVNRQLSQRLIAATEESNILFQQNIRVKNWLDRGLQSERNLKEQIQVLKGSLVLSRILYQQQQTLPQGTLLADMSTRIADLRLEQFEINQQRDDLFKGEEYIDKLVADSKEKASPDVLDALSEIVDMRRELLDQLNKQLSNQLAQSISLQINQQQLTGVYSSLQDTLTQQIFWVNSNKPIDLAWLKALPEAVRDQLAGMDFKFDAGKMLQGGLNALVFLIPLLILVGLLRWRYRLIDGRLQKLANDVGQLKRDSQMHTPQAIMLTLLKVLPGSLLLLGAGFWCYRADVGISDFLWALSQQLSLSWLVFGFTYRMLAPGGIAERHFNFATNLCAHYRRQTVRLGLALQPLIFWSVLGEKAPLRLVEDVIGQVVVILTLALLAVLVFPICRDSWREKGSHAVRLVIVTAIAATPLILLGLMFAGYFYTTLRLASRWIDSLYLFFLWNIVYLAAIRGLSVAARRLAYRRALARRQSLAKEGAEGGEPVVEEPPLALDQINEQSLRLTTMVLFAIFASAFYAIWSDLVTVISYLDSVTLWHYTSTVAGSSVPQAVTLGNMMVAFVAVIVAYVLTRNLPGLLEVVVLSRLQLRQGASYAITTILTYLITAVGAVTALGSLGVSWDKLQWLAAGLTVGLGFGLQEIFANFVSGLIILFERPIRIGDTITIGTFSGSVSKIRIRATTITDFDRKEVIIPNKAFVTERLINWSLSDTITRVLIKVGVAYGSDLDKVKAVLLQAARDNPRVMTDPEPQVFFLNFGASTLDHELRLYVRELRDRSYTVDELNRAIDRLCRENDIDIAFNQLEVYLHNQQGNEVQEVKRTLSPDEGGQPAG
ncbi:mechanosensitive channel MscK [Serratia entomophila]|uniref:mechanosensitive channel MscK n=1 Tax=Serratia entomophila TaxID=42906 RepID=UPI002178E8E8|nr:mechanosensitive channel MscK [Serratia entomophila]CAI0932615.1 Potassium efflux system KefA precursor [Serratia entomophila]CAI0937368.1 Potassium efflux system KefA precursor [Serratia entomophila]CAI0960349.1 Potassium efflux system KefA precursor [Serratia entomophila]CAI1620888.1 Potassium efflux system KefA precursor [Serratia entomophila]CAI1758523.1 Potassium efflux system KefA precursor [Serratia entomophila]